jgi:hypothetical protein
VRLPVVSLDVEDVGHVVVDTSDLTLAETVEHLAAEVLREDGSRV